jgi:hypothetical protein
VSTQGVVSMINNEINKNPPKKSKVDNSKLKIVILAYSRQNVNYIEVGYFLYDFCYKLSERERNLELP